MLFTEMGVPLPNGYMVTDSDYAASLAKYVWPLYEAKDWTMAVAFADKAKETDSISYFANVRLDVIGVCRFNVADYNGAIKDLQHFLYNLTIPGKPKEFATSDVNQYMVKAFTELKKPKETAKTYANMGGAANLIKAAEICKSTGNETLYHQLLDSMLLVTKNRLDTYATDYHYYAHELFYIAKGEYSPYDLINYALLQILKNDMQGAVTTLNNKVQYGGEKVYQPIINFLLAVADASQHPENFEQIKKALTAVVPKDGKLTNSFGFVSADEWLPYTALSAMQQKHVLELQTIMK